jgi:hypothetical protein
MSRSLLLVINIFILSIFMSHCSSDDGSSESAAPVEATFNSLWDNGFNKCGSCHDGESDEAIAELDPNIYKLTTKADFEALTNISHDRASAGCTYLGQVPKDASIAQSVIKFEDSGACENESYNVHFESGAVPSANGFSSALSQWLEAGAPF